MSQEDNLQNQLQLRYKKWNQIAQDNIIQIDKIIRATERELVFLREALHDGKSRENISINAFIQDREKTIARHNSYKSQYVEYIAEDRYVSVVYLDSILLIF